VTRIELENKLRTIPGGRDLRFCILFGSSSMRSPAAAKDVDLAISSLHPMTLMQRGALELEIEDAVGKPVDVVDVDEASTLLRWEILRHGVVVASDDETALRTFQAHVPLEYADLRPYLEREAEGLRRVLGVR
jgi:predicted nucleotidyltransferase